MDEPTPPGAATDARPVCLTVTGAAGAGMLLRVINVLAQRDLVLRSVEARVAGEAMVIRIALAPAPSLVGDVLAAKLLSLVEVDDAIVAPVEARAATAW